MGNNEMAETTKSNRVNIGISRLDVEKELWKKAQYRSKTMKFVNLNGECVRD